MQRSAIAALVSWTGVRKKFSTETIPVRIAARETPLFQLRFFVGMVAPPLSENRMGMTTGGTRC